MQPALKARIERQFNQLCERLEQLLAPAANACADNWFDHGRLDATLARSLSDIQGCRLLYALTPEGRQLSANISPFGRDPQTRGQDLSDRPYMQDLHCNPSFVLSPVYISRIGHNSCVTAMHQVGDERGFPLGYVAADFDLRDLPFVDDEGEDPHSWRQIKGDPAIRGNLFQQERVDSPLDEHIDEVHHIVSELMTERGIFHVKLHYGSARATLWLYDDPHRYRVHVLDEIIDPAVCLAYPSRQYPEDAIVPREQVLQVFNRFTDLRRADETLYLRSGSLNIINGLVGLTFSCDGCHYMPVSEFLAKPDSFWFGRD